MGLYVQARKAAGDDRVATYAFIAGDGPKRTLPDLALHQSSAPADFEPFGAFAEPAQAQAHARLTGTVIKAERRFSWFTSNPFTVAVTRTAGFEVDLCLADDEHPDVPAPGAIVTGIVSLSVSLANLLA